MSDTPKTDELAKREFVPDGLWIRHARELERENAALREDKERLDWLEECHGWPEYIDAEWHFGGEVFSSHRAAIDAARAKEAQPCQCTNGVIRSVGRDNDELIEDCPDCSGSKESQP